MSIFDPIYTDGEIDTKLKSLILNRLTKDEFDSMSAHSPYEIWFIQDSELSGQPIVVDTRPVEIPTKLSEFQNDVPYLSAVSWSQVTGKPTIPTQTSQLTNDSGFVTTADVEEEVADKRDYDDLTYSYSTPAEQFNLASLQQSNPSYDQKVSFTISDDLNPPATISWDSNHWWNGDTTDYGGEGVEVFWAEEEGYTERLCVWMGNGTSDGFRFPFDPADGQNSQSWTFTSDNVTYTLTMTFTGEQGESVSDSLALTSQLTVKRDYSDLTYNDKTVRAPTYGIGKMIATPSDGTDPVVMDTFFIHENPSNPSNTLGSTWYAAGSVFAGTTDGTNFRLVDIGFQTLTTFTKTQLLAGEVTFTYQDKTWTLTAELGDGMVEKFDIWINGTKWTTSHYDYDSQTKTSKWWFQDDGWFLTRSWTSSGSLSNFWLASLYRGDDGVHGNVLVDSANVGGTAGYRAGGYVPSVTYGDYTQSIEWQVAGYPCQGTFGFSECVPTRNSQLVNDSFFVRESEISALTSDKRDLSALQYTGLDLDDRFARPNIEQKGIRNFVLSIPDYPALSGDLVLSAVEYGSSAQTWWGRPNVSGNNIYMECRLTSEQEGIYQFNLQKGSSSSHQTIHTFSSEEIAAGVAPFQFTENDVTYDGVVSAEFATTRLATVNDISNHAVHIDNEVFFLNSPYEQQIYISKIPVTIEQDFSYDSTNYTFEWYDGSNYQYWNTNHNSKSMGVGTLTIMLPPNYTVGECFSWAANQGFSCEYCENGAAYYGSLSIISSNPLSTYPYLRIVIGA